MNEYKLRSSTVINYWDFRLRVIILQYFKFDCLGTFLSYT